MKKTKTKNVKVLNLKIRTVDDSTILGAVADEVTAYTNRPTEYNCSRRCNPV